MLGLGDCQRIKPLSKLFLTKLLPQHLRNLPLIQVFSQWLLIIKKIALEMCRGWSYYWHSEILLCNYKSGSLEPLPVIQRGGQTFWCPLCIFIKNLHIFVLCCLKKKYHWLFTFEASVTPSHLFNNGSGSIHSSSISE